MDIFMNVCGIIIVGAITLAIVALVGAFIYLLIQVALEK